MNILQGNTAVSGGELYGYKATFTGNTVQNNNANIGGGIYASQCTVRGNTVMNNTAQSDGGGLYADQGTVTYNSLSYNTAPSWGHGAGAYLSRVSDFSYNNVTSSTASSGIVGGVAVTGQVGLHYNNLYSNLPYDAEVVSSGSVSGTLNYWGPSTCTAIANQIYDRRFAVCKFCNMAGHERCPVWAGHRRRDAHAWAKSPTLQVCENWWKRQTA